MEFLGCPVPTAGATIVPGFLPRPTSFVLHWAAPRGDCFHSNFISPCLSPDHHFPVTHVTSWLPFPVPHTEAEQGGKELVLLRLRNFAAATCNEGHARGWGGELCGDSILCWGCCARLVAADPIQPDLPSAGLAREPRAAGSRC